MILGLSGVAAFVFSAGTLKLGLEQIGARYFLATLAGYATCLILIREWIAYQRGRGHGQREPSKAAGIARALAEHWVAA